VTEKKAGVRRRVLVITWLLIAGIPSAGGLLAQPDRGAEMGAHYREAAEAMRLHKFDNAIVEFEAMVRLDPGSAEAHANLGSVYYIQRKYPQASAELEAALKLKPSLVKAQSLLGMSEARSGNFEKALPLLEKCFKRERENEFRQEAGMLLIELYTASLMPDKALETQLALQQAYPSNPEVLYSAYRIYSDLAGRALSDLVRAAADSARLHQVAGELLESEGNFPGAVEQYQKALDKGPGLTGIHRALGVALLNASQDNAAILRAQKEFELELAMDPDDAHSEYELGEIYWRKHQPDEAVKHYSRAVHLRRNFTDALLALGKVWVFQGQADQALPVLREAAGIDPNSEVAHYRLAQAYRKLGQATESERELAQFRRLREASTSLGVIYQQVQRKPITEQTIESVQ